VCKQSIVNELEYPMKLVRVLVALSAFAASAALAGEKKHAGTPNCEVKGKKVHVKSQAACEKKKGTWLETAATEAAAPAEAAPAEAAPAAAPAAK
jgi:hypothetical protein